MDQTQYLNDKSVRDRREAQTSHEDRTFDQGVIENTQDETQRGVDNERAGRTDDRLERSADSRIGYEKALGEAALTRANTPAASSKTLTPRKLKTDMETWMTTIGDELLEKVDMQGDEYAISASDRAYMELSNLRATHPELWSRAKDYATSLPDAVNMDGGQLATLVGKTVIQALNHEQQQQAAGG
jgi:hypothetical protein